MDRKTAGYFLLAVSIILLIQTSLTGNAIAESSQDFSVFGLIAIILLIVSLSLVASTRTLDAIVIPTGPSNEEGIERTERAIQEYEKTKAEYFVISGEKDKGKKLKDTQRAHIYKTLREHGIKPLQMKVEGKSKETMGNIVYTFNLLKKYKHGKEPMKVGFVSYPGHLDRMEDLYKTAVRKGIIDEGDFAFYRVPTKETPEERKYESFIPRRILHKLKKAWMQAPKE